jgi:hypothetical protein
MAEFWAFMGKSKGFYCRASLKRFPRDTGARLKRGQYFFSRFEPGISRSHALKSRGGRVYHEAEAVCSFQWSTQIYQDSLVCEARPEIELYIENSP